MIEFMDNDGTYLNLCNTRAAHFSGQHYETISMSDAKVSRAELQEAFEAG